VSWFGGDTVKTSQEDILHFVFRGDTFMSKLLIETFFTMGLATLGIYEGMRVSRVKIIFNDPIGPGWYVLLLSGMLLICGIFHLLVNIKRKVIAEKRRSSLHVGPAGRVLILLALYAFLVPFVNYTLCTAFFFVFVVRICGVNSWPKSVLIGLAFTVAFQFVFSHLAGIRFP
jgi:hypothetical protein